MVDNAKGKQPAYEGSGSTEGSGPAATKPSSGDDRAGRADRARDAIGAAENAIDPGQFDAKTAKGDLDNFVASLGLPKAPDDETADDRCRRPKPNVVAPCNQRELDRNKADTRHKRALKAAASALDDEESNWEQAASQYNFSIKTADATLQAAVKDAKDTFEKKKNDDSDSRNHFLYHTMTEAVATAVQAYQASAAAAATTLAAEAGNVIAARVAYISAVNAAEAQRLADQELADQTFWQTVEGILDAV